ncbi:DUF3310 domain-containing protein [Acinetobacter calcoaceticus]|uniref:DUF3310 domain-containing protein n=1 Tax=Acinetobacter calcoaceticus TaxID=471 RepID=UPI0018DCDCCD|nr:DUF3310 domain-containing protein [Acinetobacter calcoaceticus]
MKAFDKQEGGDHYKKLVIQPMQYALANGLDAGQATIIKYVTRFKDKNGLEDLKKARHTIDLLIEHYYPEDSGDIPIAILEATVEYEINGEPKRQKISIPPTSRTRG